MFDLFASTLDRSQLPGSITYRRRIQSPLMPHVQCLLLQTPFCLSTLSLSSILIVCLWKATANLHKFALVDFYIKGSFQGIAIWHKYWHVTYTIKTKSMVLHVVNRYNRPVMLWCLKLIIIAFIIQFFFSKEYQICEKTMYKRECFSTFILFHYL